ncbi:MAG: hypothetical protein CME59_22690 [Halioglobus sp.]|nr:hypothetical protein [Halioglobus sp.]|tara:strand:+ start:189 stop:1421 length:1233 start_codon:yes stop_codon:yes gene_type:complete
MQAINFGSGVMAGYNTVDRSFQRERALDLDEARLAEASKRSDQRDDLARERLAIDQQRLDNQAGYQQESLAIQRDNAANQQDYRQFQMDRTQRAEQMAMLQQRAKAHFQNVLSGGAYDRETDEQAVAMGMPHLSVQYWLNDQNVRDNLALRPMLVNAGKGDFSDLKTEEGMALLHNVYRDQIEQGIGEVSATNGKQIASKQLISLDAAPRGQGVTASVRVQYADGSSDVKPVTLNRSSAGDDPVSIYSVEEMLDDVQGRVRLAEIFQQEDVRKSLSSALGTFGGADDADSDLPAEAKLIKFYMKMGMSQDEAIAHAKEGKNSPEKMISDMAEAILDADMSGKTTLQDALRQAKAAAASELGISVGGGAPADDGWTPEMEKAYRVMRENPNNRKYGDDDLKAAITQRMGGQ